MTALLKVINLRLSDCLVKRRHTWCWPFCIQAGEAAGCGLFSS